jgi:hypothetical protein
MKMKIAFFAFLTSVFSLTLSAQLLVDDFETGILNARFTVLDPIKVSIVDNPSKTGINTSAKVLKISGNKGSGMLYMKLNLNGQVIVTKPYDRLRFKYYRGNIKNNLVMLDPNGMPPSISSLQVPSANNAWEYVDFAIETTYYQQMLLRLDKRTEAPFPSGMEDVYIDEIQFYNSADGPVK